MAKTKAKTVTVKVTVIYDEKGRYVAAGMRTNGKRPDRRALICDAEFPHACIVDIELPIPEPLKGKVKKVKAVKGWRQHKSEGTP